MDPMLGFDIRLVLSLETRDRKLQYYKNAYISEITSLHYSSLVGCNLIANEQIFINHRTQVSGNF